MLHDISKPQKRVSKPKSNKNQSKSQTKPILLQQRDLQILQFVAKFGSVNDAHIICMLSIPNKSTLTTQVTPTSAIPLTFQNYMRIIRKLITAEYLERVKIIANEYGYIMLGSKGEALLNIKRQKKLLLNTLRHDMLAIDLYLDLIIKNPTFTITCERELKILYDVKFNDHDNDSKKLPDLLLDTDTNNHTIAIEVELTEKKQTRLIAIINNYIYNNPVKEVWYFVISIALGKKIMALSQNNPKFKIFLIDSKCSELKYTPLYNLFLKNTEFDIMSDNQKHNENTTQNLTKLNDGWDFDLDNFLKQSN